MKEEKRNFELINQGNVLLRRFPSIFVNFSIGFLKVYFLPFQISSSVHERNHEGGLKFSKLSDLWSKFRSSRRIVPGIGKWFSSTFPRESIEEGLNPEVSSNSTPSLPRALPRTDFSFVLANEKKENLYRTTSSDIQKCFSR